MAIILFSFATETMQYLQIIVGTADPIDFIVYVLAISTALGTNQLFIKSKSETRGEQKEKPAFNRCNRGVLYPGISIKPFKEDF
jgi:hypothetical protein